MFLCLNFVNMVIWKTINQMIKPQNIKYLHIYSDTVLEYRIHYY